MGDRAVDCARLESVCAERHRGFESPPIRHHNLRVQKTQRWMKNIFRAETAGRDMSPQRPPSVHRSCKMHKIIYLALLLLVGCSGQQTTEDLMVIPGERVGPITPETTRAELDELFGKENVADIQHPTFEGETIPGTVVFPDSTKEAVVLWVQQDPTQTVERVVINGSQWSRPRGLNKGDNLAAVEALNGTPFMIYGFEWDYGGLGYFKGGALDRKATVKFLPNLAQGADYADATGDKLFNSKDPAMLAVDPRVEEVAIILQKPPQD